MTTPSLSKLDTIYRKVLLSKYFTQGWGEPEKMKKIFSYRKIMADKERCNSLVDPECQIFISDESKKDSSATQVVHEGYFQSPMVDHMRELIPEEAQIARFQLLMPRKWPHPRVKPICIQLAGTGDHNYWKRRLFMANPLMKEAGIASIILENPFYGSRKPKNQHRSCLRNVMDIFTMGGCLILESIALFNWCTKMGFGPICITGISMGGHNAALAGSSWNRPISIVPCLSWTTASCSFTHGVLSESVPWEILDSQYSSYDDECRQEMLRLIQSPEDNDVFKAGKEFAKTYPEGIAKDVTNNMILSALGIFKFAANGTKKAREDTLNFMRGVMDECTHLGNFSKPVDPELAIIISALRDGYVPQQGLIPLTSLWQGAQRRSLDCGHVAAILFNSDVFRKAIIDSLELNAQKYYNASLFERQTENRKVQN